MTSTGLYATTASGSLGNFSNSTSNGLTLTLNSGSANFAGASASQTAGYQLGGTAQTAGVLSGSFTSNVTAEFGSINPVVVNYTGTAVDQRVFNVTNSTIALGRYLRTSTPTTGTTSVTSTGLYSTTASGSLGSFSTSNGLTLSLTSGSSNFAGATLNQSAGYQIGGTALSAGVLSGSFTSNVTAEFGSINPVVVNYTGTAVNQRVFTTSTSTIALGPVHQGATLSGPSLVVTSTGLNVTTANGTLGSFTGGPAGLSLGLTSGSAQFYGATASQTATYSIAGTASTLGSLSGTYSSAVTAEFGSIPDVTVAVTGQVYSGQSTWATNGSGNWGTIAGAGVNAFGLNWGANQGSPGLDPSYTNTDTATFGSAVTSGTAVISTNGANISLKAMTFNNANASYTIQQSGGSSPIAMVGSGTNASAISAVAGSHTINSNISLGSSMTVDVSAGAALSINNTISGTSSDYSLTKAGDGTLFMNAVNTYSGNTVVNAGTLSGVGTIAGPVSIQDGATLAVGADADAFGVLTVDSLYLVGGSKTSLQISGTTAGIGYDQIASLGGTLTYGGTLDLTLSGSYALGTEFRLFKDFTSTYGSLDGVTLTTPSDSPYNGLAFTRTVFGTDVVWWTQPNSSGQSLKFREVSGALIVVPEPSTIVIASIGAALAGLWRLRRRKSTPQA